MNYKEQYLNPKWQKKRLEILQRDNFKCQMCGSEDRTLHIHHFMYEKGKMIWEYDDSNFISICEQCHDTEHEEKDQLYESFIDLKKSFHKNGLSNTLLNDVLRIINPDTLKIDYIGDGLKGIIKALYFHRICGIQYYSDIKIFEKLGIDFTELKKYTIIR
jgi:hypothetical protein